MTNKQILEDMRKHGIKMGWAKPETKVGLKHEQGCDIQREKPCSCKPEEYADHLTEEKKETLRNLKF